MASLFTHVLVGVAVVQATFPAAGARLWLYAALASVVPDLDVIAFPLGIPYEHVLGHRGISHSLAAALLVGLLVAWRIRSAAPAAGFASLALVIGLVTASHGLLDAMTNGGLGIAFFAPFDDGRYFLPWRPIEVSPIGAGAFFSEWGLRVIKSELLWVWLPVVGLWVLIAGLRARSRAGGH
ncbi:MAG: metal-dependent hydrolase [Chromatiales bacterium]|nr:metal-dependent hydrolase [Chromatiales bacterium]